MQRFTSALISVLFAAVLGCDDDKYHSGSFLDPYEETKYYQSEIIPAVHQNFYGKWKLERIVGGFSGQGAPNDYDYLEVKRFGIYGLIRNNQVFESGKIEVDTFDTSQPDVLQIRFVPEQRENANLSINPYETYVQFERGGMQFWPPLSDALVREFVQESIK